MKPKNVTSCNMSCYSKIFIYWPSVALWSTFKIILTCNNANSIINDLCPKNSHLCNFSEYDIVF